MSFVYRDRIFEPHSTKLMGKYYIHQAGCEHFHHTVFGYSDQGRLDKILFDYKHLFEPADYLLGVLWFDGDTEVAELFGYGDINGWPGNPTGYTWVFRNGVWKPDLRDVRNETTCEDTDIVKGWEAMFRRKTKNLQEFLIGDAPLPPGLLDE